VVLPYVCSSRMNRVRADVKALPCMQAGVVACMTPVRPRPCLQGNIAVRLQQQHNKSQAGGLCGDCRSMHARSSPNF
jgi:hypothetical protein